MKNKESTLHFCPYDKKQLTHIQYSLYTCDKCGRDYLYYIDEKKLKLIKKNVT